MAEEPILLGFSVFGQTGKRRSERRSFLPILLHSFQRQTAARPKTGATLLPSGI
jgi:hypothetical protein